MSSVEILYRDSPAADGVQSRGVGWHRRVVPSRNDARWLTTLAAGLKKGDVVRVHGKAGELLVHDGQRLQRVKPLSLRVEDHYSDAARRIAERSAGDWASFWEACADAPGLVSMVPDSDSSRKLVLASACDLVETILHFVPRIDERPRRAIRVVRLWLAGSASLDAVDFATHEASAAASAYAPYADTDLAAAYSTAYYAAEAAHLASHTDQSGTYATDVAYLADGVAATTADNHAGSAVDRSRSLSFLVRVRIPLWRVCLAAAEGGGA